MGQQGDGRERGEVREVRDLTVQRVVVDPPDAADAVAELVQVAFGLVAVGLGVAFRTLEPASGSATRTVRGSRLPVTEVADVVVGTAWGAARVTGRLAVTGGRVVGTGGVRRAPATAGPPSVPSRPRRRTAGGAVASRPPGHRAVARAVVGDHAALRHPGGDAPGGRPGVRRCGARRRRPRRRRGRRGGRLDVDALVAGVVRRMDVDAAVAMVLARLDLGAVSSAALDQIDLNQLVLDRVDLGRVIDAALQQVDLTQVVMEQVDLVTVAEYVVAEIDLPEIIRASTGSMASETVRGLRMQGVGADQAVTRAVDRVLFRRAAAAVDSRRRAAPGAPDRGPRGPAVSHVGPGAEPVHHDVDPVPREARGIQGLRAGIVTRHGGEHGRLRRGGVRPDGLLRGLVRHSLPDPPGPLQPRRTRRSVPSWSAAPWCCSSTSPRPGRRPGAPTATTCWGFAWSTPGVSGCGGERRGAGGALRRLPHRPVLVRDQCDQQVGAGHPAADRGRRTTGQRAYP